MHSSLICVGSFTNLYHLFVMAMKQTLVLFCVVFTVAAQHRDRKTSLDDVERHYLSIQERTVLKPPPPAPANHVLAAGSPTQYGFVPVKTVANYSQQESKQNYLQSQYTPQNLQKYPVIENSQYQDQQKFSHSSPRKEIASSQDLESYYVLPSPNSYHIPENLQYVLDNSIKQSRQQYYTPQYVYPQQYQAPSTSVQTVVDPKGHHQDLISSGDHIQNYENIVYRGNEDVASVYEPNLTPQFYTANQQETYILPKNKYVKEEPIVKREPKSLLDSYIPSIVQLEYYRQAQKNLIQEPHHVPRSANSKYIKKAYTSSFSGTPTSYRHSSSGTLTRYRPSSSGTATSNRYISS